MEKNLESLIPNGIYCYNGDRVCPFWAKTTTGAYCGYLKVESGDYDCDNLVWDKVKECNINTEH